VNPKTGRHYHSRTFQAWLDAVGWHLHNGYRRGPTRAPLVLLVAFYRATRRRCDVDNLAKAIMDAGNGLVWVDDSQIIKLVAEVRLDAERPRAEVVVFVSAIGLDGSPRPGLDERPAKSHDPELLPNDTEANDGDADPHPGTDRTRTDDAGAERARTLNAGRPGRAS
jgi:Holliday junction resolvase RusA-like endonuclease